MPKEFTVTPKFSLIVEHLKAVGTLDEYVNGAGLKKDMQDLANYLQEDLNRGVLRPAGWHDFSRVGGRLYSSPVGDNAFDPKWRGVEVVDDGEYGVKVSDPDTSLLVEICPCSPVRDVDPPFVNLHVPENWEKRQQFIAKVKAPPGFELAGQYPDIDIEETTPLFKYVRYESHVGPGGFDATGFIAAFRDATKALIALEKDIDEILASLG